MRRRPRLLFPVTFLISILSLSEDLFSQNVGIGTSSPTGKFQVNHRSNVTTPGLLMMDSAISRSGNIRFRNINSSKYVELWGFSGNNFSSAEQYLDIESDSTIIATFRGNGRVGINNISPAERLDVNGNINMTGVLKINSNAGSVGQVLTSNGTGAPQWKNAAYSNNSRFAANIPINTGTGDLSYSPIYNLNPADVTISGTNLTINKTGLWHFEGYLYVNFRWSAPPLAQTISASFLADEVIYVMIQEGLLDRDPTVFAFADYVKTLHFSHDVYISGPATVRVSRLYSFVTGAASLVSQSAIGLISGYLISE